MENITKKCPLCGKTALFIQTNNENNKEIETCSVCGFVDYIHPSDLEDALAKQRQTSVPKCPKCGSTSIATGARGFNFMSGMIGANKTVNRCANCGHTWKPNGR